MPKSNVTSTKTNYELTFRDARKYVTKYGEERLRTYLGNVLKGQPKVYTAPFAKGQSMSQIIDDWNAVLVSIENTWPSLYEFEIDLSRKVGPLSVQLPLDKRFSDIVAYYDDVRTSSTPIHDDAMKSVMKEFAQLRGLRIRQVDHTVKKMKKSTNSGTPYFVKRRNVVQDTIPCHTFLVKANPPYVVMNQIEFPWSGAAVIGWRGQEGGPSEEDVKQRLVWMFPFAVNINELQVYQPLIEGAQALNLVPAWVSMDAVDREVTALFDTKGKDDLVVCTDFTRFDQHFNKDMQVGAKTIIEHLLTGTIDADMWLNDVFPIKYSIPLIYAGSQGTKQYTVHLTNGEHGMASGSGGTNVDETLAHRALQYEAAILNNSALNPHSQCLGDDGILTYPGITVDDVVKAYQSHGQECNPSKQYASTQDCVYLRRWHHQDYRYEGICVGVYSTMRALGRLRYLERFMDPDVWSPTMVALRQLSIIENCKWHPLKSEFAEFCMKRDRYRLGIDIPGFLDNITKLAKEAIDYMPDFLGYTKTLQGEGPAGISKWWIVQYLKSHR